MAANILIQLDTDAAASSFDAVVAIDAGVEHLLPYAGVQPESVEPLVHGAMFTRGGEHLRHTALFVGGSDVAAAEAVLQAARRCFFGPLRVSIMLDAGGCNTTAAAAIIAAARHLRLAGATLLVLGGTGPVGRRVAEMAALQGAEVLLASRDQAKAEAAAEAVGRRLAPQDAHGVVAVQVSQQQQLAEQLKRCRGLIACGAAGVQLVDADSLAATRSLAVAIDLNAVPPAGIAGIEVTDKAVQRGDRVDYGAIGVGGLKMKIHRQAISELFTANDRVIDAAETLRIAQAFA